MKSSFLNLAGKEKKKRSSALLYKLVSRSKHDCCDMVKYKNIYADRMQNNFGSKHLKMFSRSARVKKRLKLETLRNLAEFIESFHV